MYIETVPQEELPSGTSILWTSKDETVAKVSGTGKTGSVQGIRVGNVEISASLVNQDGQVLRQIPAQFQVTVQDKLPSVVKLDAKQVDIQIGKSYGLCVKGNNDIQDLKISIANPEIVGVSLLNGTDSRGAIYQISRIKEGETTVSVTYQGLTSVLKVKVVAPVFEGEQ